MMSAEGGDSMTLQEALRQADTQKLAAATYICRE